jgi:hypothetical protein
MASPEVAIFLGAGASCSEGAPSQAKLFAEFFSESFEDYRDMPSGHPSLQGIKALKNGLVRFFEVLFGFDPTKPPSTLQFPTFEEALGIVDLALTRDDSFRGLEGNLSPQQWGATLRDVRTNFVFLIALILDKKLGHSKGHHKLLVQNLHASGILDKCAFVSFNYDILIDNALNGHSEGRFLDYGIEFENNGAQGDHAGKIPTYLFKLHGSLNWLYCSTCRSITITRYEKGVVDVLLNPAQCRCQKCGALRVPIIIPPTYFKVLSNIFIQNVWYKAEQVLKNCRAWVFCGYSFPDADMHVKYLLKRVQVNSAPPKIVVVGWHKDKDPRVADEEKNRYRRFFGAASQLQYEKASFEEFADFPNGVLEIVGYPAD